MVQPNYWQRLQKRRISRRNLLVAGGTVALGGATAMVVGCGGGSDNNGSSSNDGTPRPSGGPPVSGGDITFGRLLNVLGIDPHIDLTGLDIDSLLYSYIYSWDPIDEEIILNNVAEEFEHPDDLTFIFKIRPGIETHPGDYPGAGETLTAEDVRQSFNRRGTSITAPDKRFAFKIAGSKDPTMLLPALQTPDPMTFKFVMAEPFVPSIREMANATWAIVPAKVIDEYGLRLSQKAFGSGPYMLDSFRGNEKIVLRKHPNYFHQGRPYPETLTYIVITEGSSLLAAFESGAHDVNGSILNKRAFDELKDDPEYTVARSPSLFYPCIQYKWKAPYTDIRVREAINLALNREEFINTINDGEGQYNGPIQWFQRKWALPQEELRAFYPFDLEKATGLMDEAGYADGFTTKMKIPKLTGATFIADSAGRIKQQLEKINITVEIDEVEIGTFIASVILPGNFETTFFPNLPYDEPDRPLSFYHSRGVTGQGNWTNYSNPELDKLIDKQSTQFVESERQETINAAQRMILKEHGPQITLPFGFQYSARHSYVHFPFEIGQPYPEDILPWGSDLWTEENA